MLSKKLVLWFVPLVSVYHDEKVAGGCDLRTEDYWKTREKCMKAWALRYRRSTASGNIKPVDWIKLARSCVLNREVITSSPVYIARQIALMKKAVRESRRFFEQKRNEYGEKIVHGFLQQY